MLGVLGRGQPCLMPLCGSRLHDSLLPILRNEGRRLPCLPQRTPCLLTGGRTTFCISTGRAASKDQRVLVGPGGKNAPTFCHPWQEPDPFLLRLAEGNTLQTLAHVTGSCASCEHGVWAAPAPTESQCLARRFTRRPAASGAVSSSRPWFQLGLDVQIVHFIGAPPPETCRLIYEVD